MSNPKTKKRDEPEQVEINQSNTWEVDKYESASPTVAVPAKSEWVFEMDTPMELVKSRIVHNGITFLKIKQIGPVGPVTMDGKKTMLRLWLCVKNGAEIPAQTYILAEPVS